MMVLCRYLVVYVSVTDMYYRVYITVICRSGVVVYFAVVISVVVIIVAAVVVFCC